MTRRLISATDIARLAAAAGFVAAALLPLPLAAQSSDYFVPSQQRQAQPSRGPARPTPQRAAPAPQAQQEMPQGQAEAEPPPPQIPMPPVPELPTLPKGTSPPAAVIGAISVPDVMRASTAAQQIDRVMGQRREKLNQDAQREQAAWREMQQTLANQRGTMSPDQIRGKERELQERITSAQRQFRDRNRIMQEAAQVSLNQIEAALIAIIRQVAESHGMNLVLHRAQIALNVADFDISEQVADQLNKLLPTVIIPPDGVSPLSQPLVPVPIVPQAALAAAPVAPLVPPAMTAPAAATPATGQPAAPTQKTPAPK